MNNLSPVGKILGQAWAVYAERMRTLFTLVAISFGLGLLGMLLALPSVGGVLFSFENESLVRPGLLGVSALWFLVLLIAMIVVGSWIQISITYAVSDEGRGEGVRALLRRSAKKILPTLVVGILFGLTVLAGFVLLVIPAIFFILWFWSSAFVVLFENKEGLDAMRQSRKYMKGMLGPVLIRLLFIWLVSIALSLLTNAIEEALGIGKSGILSGIVSVLFTPLWTAYLYFLYKEVRGGFAEPAVAVPPADPLAPVSTL